jgi:hypothetical protein
MRTEEEEVNQMSHGVEFDREILRIQIFPQKANPCEKVRIVLKAGHSNSLSGDVLPWTLEAEAWK